MPARRLIPSDRLVVVSARLEPDALGGVPVADVPVDGDADAFADAFFGALIRDPHADPMFAGAAGAGPLARDGADEFAGRLPVSVAPFSE